MLASSDPNGGPGAAATTPPRLLRSTIDGAGFCKCRRAGNHFSIGYHLAPAAHLGALVRRAGAQMATIRAPFESLSGLLARELPRPPRR